MLFDSMIVFSLPARIWRHGFGQASLLGADPPGVRGTGNQEARGVGFAVAVLFFRYSPGVIGRGTVASLAVGGADTVSILRNLHSGPVKVPQGGDQAGNHAGFTNVASVAADDD
jgi:hypothetical protein